MSNKKEFLTATVPPFNDTVLKDKFFHPEWENFHSNNYQANQQFTHLTNDNVFINSDFHWSQTKGNTPTTTDSEFVDEWFVKSNGMSFTITPTFYTDNTFSSDSGSDRFININIPTPTSAQFEIYQKFPNAISTFQNKILSVSGYGRNNTVNSVKLKAELDFDTNNDTIPEKTDTSSSFNIDSNKSFFSFKIQTVKISTSNQNNTEYLKLTLTDMINPIDLDIFYLKGEFSLLPTKLYVEHTLEKLKINNN